MRLRDDSSKTKQLELASLLDDTRSRGGHQAAAPRATMTSPAAAPMARVWSAVATMETTFIPCS